MSATPAADPAGRLHITVEHAGERISSVDIASSRPVHAARVLVGRTPQEAVRLVPLLFSLCSGAQRIAAIIACERAQALEPTLAEQASRVFALQLETVREHALRILVDWPHALGIEPDRDTAARLFALQRLITGSLAGDRDTAGSATRSMGGLIREIVLGDGWDGLAETDAVPGRHRAMLPRLLHALQASGWQTLGAGSSTPRLEDFGDDVWHARLASAPEIYARQPEVDGQPRETTPYARQLEAPAVQAARRRWGDGLATRLLALAGELNYALSKLQDSLERSGYAAAADPLDDDSTTGEGIGVVEAARGKLMHRIELSQGRIRHYQIVAPTEWNFHPRGVAAHALARLPLRSAAACAAQARALICAIDPCVAYDLDIRRHA